MFSCRDIKDPKDGIAAGNPSLIVHDCLRVRRFIPSGGLTFRFTGAKPASAAPLVERPVQAGVGRHRLLWHEPTYCPGTRSEKERNIRLPTQHSAPEPLAQCIPTIIGQAGNINSGRAHTFKVR